MSKLPRAPATTGTIRPPASGMTLPQNVGGRSFLDDVPSLPAYTQRILPSTRRATLTTATFTPLANSSATIARSSGIAAARVVGGTVSPSPSASSDSQASLTLRSLATSMSLDGIKSTTISQARGQSPAGTSSGDTQLSARGGSRQHGVSAGTPRVSRSQASGLSRDKSQRPGSAAAGLRCGSAVLIPTQGLRGTLRFLGPIDGKQGTWAGIELDEIGAGKNDGTVAGKSYFSCPPSTGIFVAPSKIELCDQNKRDANPENGPVRSISSVLSSGERPPQPNRQLGLDGRAKSFVAAPGTSQRAHDRQGSRSRIASDTQAGVGANTISSPLANRRKTLTRGAAMAPGPPTPTGQPRMRPPPATMSRGTSRTRPLSTTGSVGSNRTSSPTLSRPNSRTLAQAVGDTGASTPSRPLVISRPRVYSGSIPADTQPGGVLAGRRRAAAQPPRQAAEVAVRSAGVRGKAGLAADSTDRLKLRIDMLEAENRVLRLKSEQDKANIAASQMLARDLAPVNGSVSPPARSGTVSSDTSLQQLSDARDALERERKASKTEIERLQAQIQELQANADRNGVELSLPSPSPLHATDNSTIADLRTKLHEAVEAHSKEVETAKSAQLDVSNRLEQSEAAIAELQGKLGAKGSEVDALNERLEQRSSELGRAMQRYHELVEEREQKQAEESSEELELIPVLEKQVEKLRRELSDSESRRLALTSDMEKATSAQMAAESEVARLQHTVELLEHGAADHKRADELLAECRSCVSQTIAALLKCGGTGDTRATIIDDSDSPQTLSALLERVQTLAAQVVDRLGESAQRTEALTTDVRAKDALIAELKQQIDVSKDEGQVDDAQLQHQQERIAELESQNAAHLAEREQFTHENGVLTDYLEKLESECNRLVEDIEQLNTENLKLAEELRVASLQNSTVSLDISALDGSISADNPDGSVNELRQKHTHDMAALKLQISELEKRKDSEILRLQDEVASLEIIVEDKVFGEEELNDRIASLTSELDRLRRGQTGMSVASTEAVVAASQQQAADISARKTDTNSAFVDDEALFCEICESSEHGIADCPEVTSAATIFKQAPIDSSRAYCDNCESFCGHWTEDCPHGDEMF